MNKQEWLKEPVICASGVGIQMAKVLNVHKIFTIADLVAYDLNSNKDAENIYLALTKIIAKNKEILNSLGEADGI